MTGGSGVFKTSTSTWQGTEEREEEEEEGEGPREMVRMRVSWPDGSLLLLW
jgi:hypothetical protein